VTAEIAKHHAETEFEKYRIIQDRLFESDFDRFVELEQSAEQIRQIISSESESGGEKS
jgi:hypothetical protein